MVEISCIHTTLEIPFLLQINVTKNCYHQMLFLGLMPQKCTGGWGTRFEEVAAEKGKEGREGINTYCREPSCADRRSIYCVDTKCWIVLAVDR